MPNEITIHYERMDTDDSQLTSNALRRRYAQFAAAGFLLMTGTALVTYFLTKKMMESSAENPVYSGPVNNPICSGPVNNTTVTLSSALVNETSDVATILPMMQWTCQQLMCNATAMTNLLNLILPFVTEMCTRHPDFMSTIATTFQCVQYTQGVVPSFITEACRTGLRGNLNALNLEIDRYPTDRSLQFTLG